MLTLMQFISLLSASTGAKILGIVSYPCYSHQIVFKPLWKELSLRGHQVTTLTSQPIRDQNLVNLTEINLGSANEAWMKNMKNVVVQSKKNILSEYVELLNPAIDFVDRQLQLDEVQNLIHNDSVKFDLVIVEYFTPALFAFARRFNCPHIGIVSFDPPSFVYDFVGNPLHPVFHRNTFNPLDDKDTILGRLHSIFYFIGVKIINFFYYVPANEELVKKHFGQDYPPLWSMIENASALLINSNSVFQKVLPLAPNVVQIGGKLQGFNSERLSKEINDILDQSDGFIYFSMGTSAKTTDIPAPSLNVILQTFSQLPYVVLWKMNSTDVPNLPKNIVTSEWFPQQAVLNHSKIQVFITQGGMQSMSEAIMFNVPMIGFPIFGDQPHNVQKMVAQGYGLELDYRNLEVNQFKNAILEAIENPKYRHNLKRLSELADDQPMVGLERAVWWVEYVLRTNGAQHLKSPLLGVPFYQYYLLDVLAVIVCALFVTFYILYKLVKFIIEGVGNSRQKLKNE